MLVRSPRLLDAAMPTLFPLSIAQRDVWFGQVLTPENKCYNLGRCVEIFGAVDPAAFEAALEQTVGEIDALRLNFLDTPEGPRQFIRPWVEMVMPFIDLSGDADPRAAAFAWMHEDLDQIFDLERSPLFRYALFKIADDRFFWYECNHHIIVDVYGASLVERRVAERYRALTLDAITQTDAPSSALELLDEDEAYQVSARCQRDRQYWLEELENPPAIATLSGRPPAWPEGTVASDGYIPRSVVDELEKLGNAHGASLAAVITAITAVYLSRMTGARELILGMPVTARTSPKMRRIVGMAANVVPLRLSVDLAEPLSDLLQQAGRRLRAALRHQQYWMSELRRDIGVNPDQPSIFGTMINFMPIDEEFDFAGCAVRMHNLGNSRIEDFDFLFHVGSSDAGVRVELKANQVNYDTETLHRHRRRFMHLIEEVAGAPDLAVGLLDLLDAGERRQILQDWNATAAPFPADRCIHQIFETQAERTPEATAIVFGQTELSYAELNARANRLARHLVALGAIPDGRVAIALERGAEMMVAVLATLKAGAAYVPLDPAYPERRLACMIEDSAPCLLLTRHDVLPGLGALPDELPVVVLDAAASPWAELPASNLDSHALGLAPSHLAYVIYTSGSTGAPKGVMVTHRNLVNSTHARLLYYPEQVQRFLLLPSFAFDSSVAGIFWTLCQGGALVLPADDAQDGFANGFAPLGQLIAGHAVTHLLCVPSLYAALLDHLPAEALATLTTVVVAGEPCLPPLVARHGVAVPGAALYNEYGPTECSVWSTVHRCEPGLVGAVPIGRPIANTSVYILDAQLAPAPIGVTGEIFIGGAGVARGYFNRPELTAERFLPDPFAADGRIYRTGDLGRWLSDGTIEFQGRSDDQVKIRGFRIEPGEIEAAMVEYAGVREAAVLAREDQSGEKRLVGYFSGAAEISAAGLRAHLAGALPAYMVPGSLVQLDALPRTANGKLDRSTLPVPDGEPTRYEPPQGPTETAIAAVWADLLHLDQVGRHDNFFELGGHSLLAVSLIERLRRLGWQLEARTVFTQPTVAALAAAVGFGRAAVEIPPNLIAAGSARLAPELLTLRQSEIDRISAAVPGGVGNISDLYPLAPLQEGILLHHLMSAGGDAYLLHVLLAFDSRARLDRFVVALQAVIDRHDVLRTSFFWEGLTEPAQLIWRRAALPVEEIVLAGGDAVAEIRRRFDRGHTRIDIRQAPLLRAAVAWDAAQNRWLMLLLCHHLVIDHTTLDLIIAEVRAGLAGETSRLPAAPPFRDFVAETRLATSPAEHEAFFRRMLGDIDEPTAPFGRLDIQGDGSGVEEAQLQVEPELARRLRAQARLLGVTAASPIHLAWGLVLARTSGRDDVVFGTVLFGRMHGAAGIDRALGQYINTLPLRLGLKNTSVTQAVRDTHERLAQLLRHEHASLSQAQRCSALPAGAPLFTALLNYRYAQGATGAAAESGQVAPGVGLLFAEERTNYPLALAVDDFATGFRLEVQAAEGIDPARVCGYMHTALEELVRALEQSPLTAVERLPVLPAAEQYLLLDDWNATAAPFPADRCVHELFEQQVALTPDAVALAFGAREVSYAGLNARANRLAHHLIALGVGPDQRVAIALERGVDMVVALLAVLKAGGAYVPLDPAFPAERLRFMIADSAPRVLLTQRAVTEQLPAGWGAVPAIVTLDHDLPAALPETNPAAAGFGLEPGDLAPAHLAPAHLAYVIYTSGSTGMPKGVAVPHRALVNFLWSMRQRPGLAATDVLAAVTTISFDIAALELYLPLITGARIELVARETAIDGKALVELLERSRATVLQGTPATWRLLREAGWQGRKGFRAFCGGEALSRDLADAILGGADELWNLYGPTETTVWSSLDRIMPGNTAIGVGRPIANTRIYILDPHRMPVPIGVAGEIYIGGAGVAREYLNRPGLTAERFLPDPFAGPADQALGRMYRTGDLGRWLPDGTIELLGRTDHQIKLRGFRIEPGEIEARLREYPGVRESVVVARRDQSGEQLLIAYFTGAPEISAGALRSHLAAALPGYMVPAALVQLEALPLTSNGKLDRRALPAPGGRSSDSLAVPATITEEALARIWGDVLRLGKIGRSDDFFALGGHSLAALQVVSRVRELFNCELSLKSIFDLRTLEAIACRLDLALLENRHLPPMPPIGAMSREGPAPLSYSQERMWLIQSLAPENTAYNIVVGLWMRGDLDVAALSGALDQLYQRHEILRSTITLEHNSPVQHVEPWAETALAVQDLRDRGGRAGSAAVTLAEAEARAPFDLARGPVIRSKLFQTGAGEHLLVIVVHHVAADQWSLGVLGRELAALYNGRRAGTPVELEPLPISYRDYAIWQRDWLEGAESERQLSYWREKLANLPSLELPTDRPRPQAPSLKGAVRQVQIPAALIAELEQFGRATGTTLFMIMFTAFAALLHRISGATDIPIGVPVANRIQPGTEGLVGTFVNTLVMRTDLAGDPQFGDLLQHARATTLEAFAHQDVSFDRLVQELGQRRNSSQAPLAQVLFNVANAPMHGIGFDGLAWEPVLMDRGGAQFELSISVDTEVTRKIAVEYNTELFDPGTIERLIRQYLTLLEGAVASPQTRLGALPLLPPDQLAILRDWNESAAPYPQDRIFAQIFEDRAARSPAATAISFQGASLTYAELNARANTIAARLRELGVGPGVLVGLCVGRSLNLLVALLGIQKSGGAYVPLDPDFPRERLEYMLSDSGAKVLVTAGKAADGLDFPVGLKILNLGATLEQRERKPAANLPASARPEDPAYVIYTSGSTGRPKGVAVSHGALVNFLWSMRRSPGLAAADQIAAVTTISFDIAGLELYLPLLSGSRIELVSRETAVDGRALAQLLTSSEVSVLQATPSMWRMLIEAGWAGRPGFRALCGGEPLPRDLADAILERVDELWNLYGPTETTIWSTAERVVPGTSAVSIGRPIGNTQVHILDANGEMVPIGNVGEICIGGAGVAIGYHGRPALTAERFIADRFSAQPGARLYRTGDLGRWGADGKLYHLGRSDHQVKIRGFRIELGEIEAMLRGLGGVRQAVVTAGEAQPGDWKLVAYVVYEDGEDLTVTDVRRYLRQHLPEYMIPSIVVALDAVPLSPSGKVDRNALPDPFRNAQRAVAAHDPPAPGMEQTIAEIWQSILRIDRIDAGDNFFEIGGHSLLSLRVAQVVEKRTGFTMDPRALFFNNLRQVAALVGAEAATAGANGL